MVASLNLLVNGHHCIFPWYVHFIIIDLFVLINHFRFFKNKIFGFANIFIWGASIWFVYKETHFHQRTMQPHLMMQPGAVGAGMMAGPGGMMQQQPGQQPSASYGSNQPDPYNTTAGMGGTGGGY